MYSPVPPPPYQCIVKTKIFVVRLDESCPENQVSIRYTLPLLNGTDQQAPIKLCRLLHDAYVRGCSTVTWLLLREFCHESRYCRSYMGHRCISDCAPTPQKGILCSSVRHRNEFEHKCISTGRVQQATANKVQANNTRFPRSVTTPDTRLVGNARLDTHCSSSPT